MCNIKIEIMKTILVSLVCSLLLSNTFSVLAGTIKEEKVPPAVKTAFSEKYSDIEVTMWKKIKSTYVAKFCFWKT